MRKQLMAYQRVINLAGGSDNSQALLAKGFDSSYAITSLTEDQFAGAAGLPPQTAAGIYDSTCQEMVQVGHSS